MLFSIVIPAYNVEDYIRQCLDSYLDQDFKDIEVVVVDDGSTDKTGIILDEYSVTDDRVKVFHKNNGGVSSALNIGLRNAQGDYIMTNGADDYAGEAFLDKLSAIIINNPGKDCYISNYCDVYENQGKDSIVELISEFDVLTKLSRYDLLAYLYKNNGNSTIRIQRYAIKREILIDNGIFYDEEIRNGEDYDYTMKVFRYIRTAYPVSECAFNARIFRDKSLTSKPKTSESILMGLKLFEKWYRIFSDMDDIETDDSIRYLRNRTAEKFLVQTYFLTSIPVKDRQSCIEFINAHRYIFGSVDRRKHKLAVYLYKILGFNAGSWVMNHILRINNKIRG